MRLAAELRTTPAYLLGETDNPSAEIPDFQLSHQEKMMVKKFRSLKKDDQSIIDRLLDSFIHEYKASGTETKQ
jgi:hypothetical protein